MNEELKNQEKTDQPNNYEAEMADVPAFDEEIANRDHRAEKESGPKKIDLNTPIFTEKFAKAEIYHKKGSVNAVRITEEDLKTGAYADKDIRFDEKADGYVVDTYVMRVKEDGSRVAELEDTRKVVPGDWLVTNPIQQADDHENNYTMSDDTFRKRYESTDTEGVYRAKGMARIIKNETGGPVQIDDPWGSIQEGDADCYFCAPYDRDNPDYLAEGRRYILSENDFANYVPASEILGENWNKDSKNEDTQPIEPSLDAETAAKESQRVSMAIEEEKIQQERQLQHERTLAAHENGIRQLKEKKEMEEESREYERAKGELKEKLTRDIDSAIITYIDNRIAEATKKGETSVGFLDQWDDYQYREMTINSVLTGAVVYSDTGDTPIGSHMGYGALKDVVNKSNNADLSTTEAILDVADERQYQLAQKYIEKGYQVSFSKHDPKIISEISWGEQSSQPQSSRTTVFERLRKYLHRR